MLPHQKLTPAPFRESWFFLQASEAPPPSPVMCPSPGWVCLWGGGWAVLSDPDFCITAQLTRAVCSGHFLPGSFPGVCPGL